MSLTRSHSELVELGNGRSCTTPPGVIKTDQPAQLKLRKGTRSARPEPRGYFRFSVVDVNDKYSSSVSQQPLAAARGGYKSSGRPGPVLLPCPLHFVTGRVTSG